MSNRVDTRSGSKSLGRAHVEIGINNRHIREQLIVCERIFYACLFIGDYRERRNLTACTRRCRDSNKIRLFAHFRESVNTLSDIHEAHCHIHEVDFGVFVHNPHNLACVHSGAAAQSDDAVGFESSHLRGAFLSAFKRRIGRYVEERGVLNTHFVEFVGDGFGVSVVI